MILILIKFYKVSPTPENQLFTAVNKCFFYVHQIAGIYIYIIKPKTFEIEFNFQKIANTFHNQNKFFQLCYVFLALKPENIYSQLNNQCVNKKSYVTFLPFKHLAPVRRRAYRETSDTTIDFVLSLRLFLCFCRLART